MANVTIGDLERVQSISDSDLVEVETSTGSGNVEIGQLKQHINEDVEVELANKVDKVVGKGLSTEDYTSDEKAKLAGLENYDDTAINNRIDDVDNALDTKVDKVAGKQLSDENFTTSEKSKLAGLENYDDSEVRGLIDGKVDKVEGKQLSDENFTADEKAKLAGLENYDDTDVRSELSNKVDKVAGKQLSDENFTTELRNKLEQHEDPNFKGVFLGLAALQSAYSGGAPGQYATVDDGEVVQWYAWNSTTEAWEPRVGESTELTPQQVAQYYESIADRNAFRDEDKALVDSLKQEAPVRKVNGKVPVSGEVSLTIEDIGAQPKQRGIYGPAIPALNRYLLSSSHTGTSELRVSAWGTVYGYDQFNLLAADGRITIPSWAKLARVSAHIIPVQSGVGIEVEIRRGSRYGKGDQNTPAITPIMKVSSTDVFEIIVRITSGAAVTFNTASWLCIELYE